MNNVGDTRRSASLQVLVKYDMEKKSYICIYPKRLTKTILYTGNDYFFASFDDYEFSYFVGFKHQWE